MSVKCRRWVLKSHFSGMPKREDLDLVEEELPPLKDGEFLCEALWLSMDPYFRPASAGLALGSTMMGAQVAKVTQSKSSKYAVGDLVVGPFGWRTHTNVPETGYESGDLSTYMAKLDPTLYKDRESTALGVLGMPGATAYCGFLNLCTPKEGETLVVNGAAGAVGSLVGQIAKIKGCNAVGFAGSDKKVEYLKSLGFDEALNYKTMGSLSESLKKACPKGIDLFYDNVGGEWFENVLAQMNTFGRVAVCGAISQYNATEQPKGHYVSQLILGHQLRVEGFLTARWLEEWPKAFKQMSDWISEGKLKYEETITVGFDNAFDAFLGLFSGANTGKAIVKI
ncbi:prostaglandin reductase 1-like [Halichondria panicea]|uniref:prostaglandin reductase 1-like n=1 Tax=Halichondria panicea TaxID=6063 RepID=UPI00312B66A0